MAEISRALQDCFPTVGPIAAYVHWAAPLTHAPPLLHLAAAIPMVAFEMARRGLSNPFQLPTAWFAVVAPPASAKSSAMRRARRFTTDLYRYLYAAHPENAPAPWVDLEGSMPGVLQQISRITPTHRRTCGILFHTEVSKILRQEDAIEPLNKIYDGEPYTRNLRYVQKQAELGGFTGSQGGRIADTVFSAVVATTPSSLKRVMRPETLGGGFFSRFIWLRESLSADELMPFEQLDEQGRSQAIADWGDWWSTLEGWRVRGLPSTRAARFSADAEAFYRETLFEALRDRMVREDFTGGLAARVAVHAARVSAIYAFSRLGITADGVLEISLDDIGRAANLAWRSMTDGMLIGEHVSASSLDLGERADRLLGAVRDRGVDGATRKDCYAALGGHVQKRDLDAMLDTLEDAGVVVRYTHTPATGRAWSRIYAVEFFQTAVTRAAETGRPQTTH